MELSKSQILFLLEQFEILKSMSNDELDKKKYDDYQNELLISCKYDLIKQLKNK